MPHRILVDATSGGHQPCRRLAGTSRYVARVTSSRRAACSSTVVVLGVVLALGALTGCSSDSKGSVTASTTPIIAPNSSSASTPSSQSPSTDAPPASDGGPTTTNPATSGGFYIVQAGDGLLKIASLLGTTLDRLLAANGWTDPNQPIFPGMKLKLPTHVQS